MYFRLFRHRVHLKIDLINPNKTTKIILLSYVLTCIYTYMKKKNIV